MSLSTSWGNSLGLSRTNECHRLQRRVFGMQYQTILECKGSPLLIGIYTNLSQAHLGVKRASPMMNELTHCKIQVGESLQFGHSPSDKQPEAPPIGLCKWNQVLAESPGSFHVDLEKGSRQEWKPTLVNHQLDEHRSRVVIGQIILPVHVGNSARTNIPNLTAIGLDL